MEQEPFAARLRQSQIVEKIFDMIVDTVCESFPDHGDVRLNIYEHVADNLHGMVRALRGVGYQPIIDTIQKEF